jgi:hypothetical protein
MGICNWNVEPLPIVVSTQMLPPCGATAILRHGIHSEHARCGYGMSRCISVPSAPPVHESDGGRRMAAKLDRAGLLRMQRDR